MALSRKRLKAITWQSSQLVIAADIARDYGHNELAVEIDKLAERLDVQIRKAQREGTRD